MSPELQKIVNMNQVNNINVEKCNVFSLGLILLRMKFLFEELQIKDYNKYEYEI